MSSTNKNHYQYRWLFSLAMPLWPFASYLLVEATANPLFWWLGSLVGLGLAPALDYLLGSSTSNLDEQASARLAANSYYPFIVYLFVPLQWLATLFGLWVASTGVLHGIDWLGWALTLGVVNGLGINAAHELGHKRGQLSRTMSMLALIPSCYGHFLVEHNRGHHVKVATPEDPASARLGESFWRFLPRSVLGGLVSAWHLETIKLQRQQHSAWHWRNENLQGWAGSLLVLIAASYLAGWAVGLLLLGQAVYAFSLLEVINYVEHYGLKRQKLANARYEPCSPVHSWNSNTRYGNLSLYQLQRHSDHHANPTRPYQILRHFDESPQLPTGYFGMLMLAYLPPLWFKLMDKRVMAHYNGNIELTNRLQKSPDAKTSAGEEALLFVEQRLEQFRQQLQGLFH